MEGFSMRWMTVGIGAAVGGALVGFMLPPSSGRRLVIERNWGIPDPADVQQAIEAMPIIERDVEKTRNLVETIYDRRRDGSETLPKSHGPPLTRQPTSQPSTRPSDISMRALSTNQISQMRKLLERTEQQVTDRLGWEQHDDSPKELKTNPFKRPPATQAEQ
jgi:hypothetical protein